jgi:hypothetical protein
MVGAPGPERDRCDDARITYHSEMIVIATSLIWQVARQGRLLTMLNRREISARRMLLSRLQTTGKTTALKQQGSPRMLGMEFARFLGLPPIKRSFNTTDVADAVCQVLTEARCDLNLATAAGEDMSDHPKYFTEHLPATFVMAGIDAERRLSGVRGKQILGRSVLIRTGPFRPLRLRPDQAAATEVLMIAVEVWAQHAGWTDSSVNPPCPYWYGRYPLRTLRWSGSTERELAGEVAGCLG